MSDPKIGVATSIFAEKQFDPFATIDFCQRHSIQNIQLYLDAKLEHDTEKIETLAHHCEEAHLKVFCHSPYFLNKDIIDGHHIASLSRIFPKHQNRYTVIHFDEKSSLKENLSTIERLNNSGITVCLENFYIAKTRESLIENFNNYATLYGAAMSRNLDIIPVIDFPRLFIESFHDVDALFLTELLLHKISLHKAELILHLIDTKHPRQAREDWTPFGSGVIPYGQIFQTLKTYDLTVISAILEYEQTDLAYDSLTPLSAFLAE